MKLANALWYAKSLIKCTLLFTLDSAVIATASRRKTQKKNRLFLIRVDAIGDYILWRNSAERLIKEYAQLGYETVLLANTIWAELAEKDLPHHILWEIDPLKFNRNLFYRFRISRRVANGNFSVAINPTYSRSFVLTDALIRLSRADIRIGSEGEQAGLIPWLKRISDSWYTKPVPAAERPLMELSRNAEFMKELGYTDFGLSLPHFHTRAIVRRKELAKLSYIVLFPGANWEGRQWPARRFADIASKVYKETGLISVVCGRPADKKLAEEISTSTDTPVVDLTGKTSLCELIGAIAGAVAVVTNETSAVHIAAAVNTPSVCILGGGHFGRFMPYPLDMPNSGGGLPMPVFHTMSCFNCEWKCPYIGQKNQEKLPAPCIEAISSKNVYMQLMKCLNSQARDSKFCLSHKCL